MKSCYHKKSCYSSGHAQSIFFLQTKAPKSRLQHLMWRDRLRLCWPSCACSCSQASRANISLELQLSAQNFRRSNAILLSHLVQCNASTSASLNDGINEAAVRREWEYRENFSCRFVDEAKTHKWASAATYFAVRLPTFLILNSEITNWYKSSTLSGVNNATVDVLSVEAQPRIGCLPLSNYQLPFLTSLLILGTPMTWR